MLKKVILAAAMATMMMGATAMASGSLSLGGSSSVYPLAQKLTTQYNVANSANPITFTVLSSDSGTGITGVAAGTYDIGDASRNLKSTDPAGLVATTICQDAVVMVVNKNNTAVKNLTNAQIKAIYAGTITNWKQLGGADASIVVVTREDGSGTLDFFKSTFMGTSTITANATVENGSANMRTFVAGSANAIGFISLGYVDSSLNGLQLNGVTATVANCQGTTPAYGAVRNFNMITKGAPIVGSNAQLFLSWVTGTAGQAVVSADGEVPLATNGLTATSLRATKSLRATR
jgi:phosphate transport system substrate-binding protein